MHTSRHKPKQRSKIKPLAHIGDKPLKINRRQYSSKQQQSTPQSRINNNSLHSSSTSSQHSSLSLVASHTHKITNRNNNNKNKIPNKSTLSRSFHSTFTTYDSNTTTNNINNNINNSNSNINNDDDGQSPPTTTLFNTFQSSRLSPSFSFSLPPPHLFPDSTHDDFQTIHKQLQLEQQPTLITIEQLLNNNQSIFKPRLIKIINYVQPRLTLESQTKISNLIFQHYSSPQKLFIELCKDPFQISNQNGHNYKFMIQEIIKLSPHIYPNINDIDLYNETTSIMVKMNPTIQLSWFKSYFNLDPKFFQHLITIKVERIIPDCDVKAIAETIYKDYTNPESLLPKLPQCGVSMKQLTPLLTAIYPQNPSIKKMVDKFIKERPYFVQSIVNNIDKFNTQFDLFNNAFVDAVTHKLYPMEDIISKVKDFRTFCGDESGELEFFTNLFNFAKHNNINQQYNQNHQQDMISSLDELVNIVLRPSSINQNIWFGRGDNIKDHHDKSYNLAPQKYQFITPQITFLYTSIYTLIQIFAAIKLQQFNIPNLIQKKSNKVKVKEVDEHEKEQYQNGTTTIQMKEQNEEEQNEVVVEDEKDENETITTTQIFTNAESYINNIPEEQIAHIKLLCRMSGSYGTQLFYHNSILQSLGPFKSNYHFVQLFQNKLCFPLVSTAGFGLTEIFNPLQLLCFRYKIPLVSLDCSAQLCDHVSLYYYTDQSIIHIQSRFSSPNYYRSCEPDYDPTPSLDSINYIKNNASAQSVFLFEPRELSARTDLFHLHGEFINREISPLLYNQNKLFFSTHSQPSPNEYNARTDEYRSQSSLKGETQASLQDRLYPSFIYLHFINNNYHHILQLLFPKLFHLLQENNNNQTDEHKASLQHIKTLLFPFTQKLCNPTMRSYLYLFDHNKTEFLNAFSNSRIILQPQPKSTTTSTSTSTSSSSQNQTISIPTSSQQLTPISKHSQRNVYQIESNDRWNLLIKRYTTINTSYFSHLYKNNNYSTSQLLQSLLTPPPQQSELNTSQTLDILNSRLQSNPILLEFKKYNGSTTICTKNTIGSNKNDNDVKTTPVKAKVTSSTKATRKK